MLEVSILKIEKKNKRGQQPRFWLVLALALILIAGTLAGCGQLQEPAGPPVTPVETPAEVPGETADTGQQGQPGAPVSLPELEARLEAAEAQIHQDGRYTSPKEVAAYLHRFGQLPENFLTKREAGNLGWESNKGNLWDVTDQMSIGGDRFGNREGRLPDQAGRIWYECDVNYQGGYRGAERLVYSNDGLIFYTEDHYESFIQFY